MSTRGPRSVSGPQPPSRLNLKTEVGLRHGQALADSETIAFLHSTNTVFPEPVWGPEQLMSPSRASLPKAYCPGIGGRSSFMPAPRLGTRGPKVAGTALALIREAEELLKIRGRLC